MEEMENLKRIAEWVFPLLKWDAQPGGVFCHVLDKSFNPSDNSDLHLLVQNMYREWLIENDGTINTWWHATKDWDSLEHAIIRDVFND